MKIGIGTKIFLSLAGAVTGLLGIMYLVYLGIGSVNPNDNNNQPAEQFQSGVMSNPENNVSYTGNICAECGGQCPTDTELQLIDKDMDSYYICGTPSCIESHNKKVYNRKSEPQYRTGNDGRLYENEPCGLCGGSGIEEVHNSLGVESRVCPMCRGKGHQNY